MLFRSDFLGAALLAVFTTTFMLAILWARPAYGDAAPETLGLYALSLVLVAAFVFQERRHPEAILPLFLFRNRQFVQANLIVMAIGGGIFASIQYLPMFVQTSLGTSATMSGLIATPQSVGVAMTSIIGGQLASRTGRYKRMVVVGAVAVLLGTAGMLTLTVGSNPAMIAVFMGAIGLGLGFVLPLMSTLVQNSVPQELMGVASSARQFFMSVVQVLGVAILGVIFTTGFANAFRVQPVDRAEVPAAVYEQFLDPTLPLDPGRFTAVRSGLQKQPGGEALLGRLAEAQRTAMSVATHRLFIATTGIAVLLLIFAVTLHEVPLRRSFGTPSAPTPDHP